MKWIKRVLLILLLLVVTGAVGGYFYFRNSFKAPPNQLRMEQGAYVIPFTWQGDTLHDRYDGYAALLLPVSLPGCSHTFYMQFDLGAPYSMFYKHKMDAIHQRFNNLSIQQEENTYRLMNYTFRVGALGITAAQIPLRQFTRSTGIDWSDSAINIIGTIGADLIENKVLVLNYPRQTIYICETLPDSIKARILWGPFSFKERRILLPAVISNKKTDLLFDTGSSAYELLTSEALFNQLSRAGDPVETYRTNSWDDTLTVYNKRSDAVVTMAGVSLPLHRVTRIEGMSFIQRMLMRFSGMGGMTGNKLFINHSLVLDTKNQQFGVLAP